MTRPSAEAPRTGRSFALWARSADLLLHESVIMRLPFVIAMLSLLPMGASAQPTPRPVACTYQTCALRVESGWLGRRLVRGQSGELVANIGLFGPSLVDIVQGSDSATYHARIYERDRRVANVLVPAGIVLTAIPLVRTRPVSGETRSFTATDWTLLGSGLLLEIIGGGYAMHSERALTRSVWWYNGSFTR